MSTITITPTIRVLTIQRGGATPTGPAGGDLAGGYPNPTVAGVRGLPWTTTAPTDGQVAKWDQSLAEIVWATGGGGGVTSITAGTGLTGGTITTSGTIAADFGTAAGTVCQGDDSRLSDARTPLSHTHGNITNAGAIGSTSGLPIITGTSGVLQVGSFGTTGGTFAQGNDSRLSDARTPTAHKSTHALLGSDPLSAADIGAADALHGHGQISTVGTIGSTANLPLITRTGGEIITGTFGTGAATFCEGNDSRLSNARTPTGSAGGDLTGTYPNPTVANDAVTYAKIQNVTATDRLLGRSSAGSGDVEEIVCTAYARGLLDDADAATARTTLGLGTTDTPKFAAVTLENDELIRNTVNGRVDIMPAPTSSSAFGFYIDTTTYGFGVKLGIIRSSDGVLNPVSRAILVDCALLMGDGVDIGVGSAQWYTISAQGSSQKAMTIGVLTGDQNAGSSGALVVVQNNQRGQANRIPTTDHTHPTLYVYAAGAANAADYVRVSHDTTNGTVEAGRGVLTLIGASGVRMNGGFGFGTAPTAVQTGYTTFANLATDRTCDADATSTAELADILGTLIEDLKAKGIISA